MRLSVSNLAWPADMESAALDTLGALGVSGIEVAPTRLAPWPDLTPARLISAAARYRDSGLQVSSLQAVLFGCPGMQLLGDQAAFEAMRVHLRCVAGMAATLGAQVLVFGAPKNRLRGDLKPDIANACAAERFRMLADATGAEGVTIAIEPVPEAYGGDFLQTAPDICTMVATAGHPFLKVHLDTACVTLGGGNIEQAIQLAGTDLCHFHAAQPGLTDFNEPIPAHAIAGVALAASGYNHWVAIEMLPECNAPLEAVEIAIRTVRSLYQFGS